MPIVSRSLILDLFIFDEKNRILVAARDKSDIYLKDTISTPILTLPLGHHPIDYIRAYLSPKGLNPDSIKLLPAFYQNIFDSEPEVEYLVTSYLVKLSSLPPVTISGDGENPHLAWLDFDEFKNHPSLIPEFRLNGFTKVLEGVDNYYTGKYRDSDGSNEVLSITNY